MRILLTGGTGFVGRHLLRLLAARGDRVAALVREASPRKDAVVSPGVDVCVHDGSTAQMLDSVSAVQPDVVVHLASTFIVQHQPGDVDALVEGNLRFGLQLMEAMRQAGARRLVCAGTSWQHFQRDSYRPVNLYAATKQAFEDLAAYYADAEGFTVTHLRLFDTYGPGDERPKLMRYLVESTESGRPLDMSPGEQLLDLVHVDDVAGAFARAIDRQMLGEASGVEVFAVSSGRLISLRDLVGVIGRVTGRPLQVRFGGRPYRAREVMRPWQEGRALPGWQPRVTLEEGLRRLVGQRV